MLETIILIVVIFFVYWLAAKSAVEGYEDDDGFHYGEKQK